MYPSPKFLDLMVKNYLAKREANWRSTGEFLRRGASWIPLLGRPLVRKGETARKDAATRLETAFGAFNKDEKQKDKVVKPHTIEAWTEICIKLGNEATDAVKGDGKKGMFADYCHAMRTYTLGKLNRNTHTQEALKGRIAALKSELARLKREAEAKDQDAQKAKQAAEEKIEASPGKKQPAQDQKPKEDKAAPLAPLNEAQTKLLLECCYLGDAESIKEAQQRKLLTVGDVLTEAQVVSYYSETYHSKEFFEAHIKAGTKQASFEGWESEQLATLNTAQKPKAPAATDNKPAESKRVAAATAALEKEKAQVAKSFKDALAEPAQPVQLSQVGQKFKPAASTGEKSEPVSPVQEAQPATTARL